jgi:hypothetical protein
MPTTDRPTERDPVVIVHDTPEGSDRVHVTDQPVRERVLEMDPPEARLARRDAGMRAAKQGFGRLSIGGIAVGTLVLFATFLLVTGIVAALMLWISPDVDSPADLFWLTGAVAGGVALFVAGLAGGWATGRIARYDGAANAAGSAIAFLVLTGLTGTLATWLALRIGAQIQIDWEAALPAIVPGDFPPEVVGGIAIAIGIALLVAGSLIGGAIGEAYHRRADRVIADVASAAPAPPVRSVSD